MEAARDPQTGGGPVVVGANWYQFRAGERIHHLQVESACLLWVHSGSGTVTCGGASHRLTPGMALWLPWAHDVDYRPDQRAPFRLGTVHVVPWHQTGVPVVPRVAHQPADPLLGATQRRGSEDEQVRELPAESAAARQLARLGSYVVDRFAEGGFDEPVFRALGEVLLAERRAWATTEHPGSELAGAELPPALARMTGHILARLAEPISLAEVAAIGSCSTATAQRLFTRWTGRSVAVWIRDARLREAAHLLRTSSLRVGEVATAVGFSDPLYFSRVFAHQFGVPPSRFSRDLLRP